MNDQQQSVHKLISAPQLVNGASATTTAFDTVGFDSAKVKFVLGVTDAALTVLKVQESDDSGMSGATDVTGLVYGTSTDPDSGSTSALPTATDDNKAFVFHIDLKGRKRYLDLVATVASGTTGANLYAEAELSKANEGATSGTTRGFAANLIA